MSATAEPWIPPGRTNRLTAWGVDHPRSAVFACFVLMLVFAAAFPWAKIDTNPKNMLPPEAEVRVWNDSVERRFGLHEDTIAVAVRPARGVLDTDSLQRLQRFSAAVVALPGVVKADVTSLFTVDNVTASGESLRIAPLLSATPRSPAEIDALRQQLFESSLFVDRLIAKDGKTTAIYIPLQKGADGAKLAEAVRAAARENFAPEEVFVTGDPVARDLFGAEMFKLMGIFAPIAGALMMALMWWMFRSWWLAGTMMFAAMVSIVVAMGTGIALGFPVHIMSSMAPVFLMAIATDSIHIFNEFFQRWRPGLQRAEVVRQTIAAVARPVRYTALATALGFGVLLFMTVVPVKVFGGIVVLGTLVLRALSFYLVPACLMLVPLPEPRPPNDSLARLTAGLAAWSSRSTRLLLLLAAGLVLFSAWGASRSTADNNMLRWFKEGSEVRQADAEFNRHLGGAMPASLVIDSGRPDGVKEPAVLKAIETLQAELQEQQLVGASLSVVDYLKRIDVVLNGNGAKAGVVPADAQTAGQYLLAFSMGARPSDLNRVVDHDHRYANVLLQLKSGDARDMQRLESRVQQIVRDKALPVTAGAAGAAHFNLVWNQVVLADMILGFGIALAVVFAVLAADFRSLKWACVAYVPLLGTVLLIFGVLGWIGKPIDMPVAVLACLSLGMAVDFAIRFVTRYRQRSADLAPGRSLTDGARAAVLRWTIEWPGKGVVRNALMFAVAFSVMLAAPLTPYVTVGAFIVSMMVLSALASLTLLPALIAALRL
jgi:uncharacterized protein